MKLCPTCQNKYPDDANFCPREECAGANGPQRLVALEPPPRFVPVSRIGGGGSGEVWQASDSSSGSAVAYKIVAPEALPTPAAFDRAQRELRQLQRTGSPRIVKVIDFGKTPEGKLFIASELTEGEPLPQVLARTGPLPLDRAKRIIAQIGEALLDAQKVGVVHRDLSAKNVLVSADDEVKLINFAVARPVSETLFGVPEYMSPEQAEGKLIDQRSNTYSLGAVLYFALTGQPPLVGPTPQATLEQVLKGEITPPSIKRGDGLLNTEVDRVVLKALERNSSRRPLTMRQFLTDVAALIVTEQPAANANSTGGARDATFAKTMMFAGGASEVQKLVAQAVAARQAADDGAEAGARAASSDPATRLGTGTPPPVAARAPTPAPVSAPTTGSGRTPSPAGRPSHGAAVAATMVAMPAASAPGGTPKGTSTSTSSLTPPLGAAVAGSPEAAGAGGNFRETLWFKKGDVDQMVADARAKVAAIEEARKAAVDSGPVRQLGEDGKPLDERYVDDGTVSPEDRRNFSLRSGPTSTSQPARGGVVPGDRMTESEVLSEIGGGKRIIIIAVVAAVAIALIAVVTMAVRGKNKGESAETAARPAPVQEPAAPPAPPPPAPPAPPKEVAPPTPVPPAAEAAPANAEEPEEAAPAPAPKSTSASSKKKTAAAKKKQAAKKHR